MTCSRPSIPRCGRPAAATRSGCSAASPPPGWPRWPRTSASCAGWRPPRRPQRLPRPAAVVPGGRRRSEGRRVLLHGVRPDRGPAAILRRPRHPGRRPPQGGQRPRRADRRRRPALPGRLLRPGAVHGRLAAGALPVDRPARAAAGAGPGRGRHRAAGLPRPARRPHAARPGVEGAGRPGAAAAARLRHRGERRQPSGRSPTSSTAATSEHRMAQEMLPASAASARSGRTASSPAPRRPRCSTPTRATPASSGSSGSASWPVSGLTFDEALQAVRAGTVFTTHTPVPAGIDRFGKDLVRSVLHAAGSRLPRLPVDRVLELGRRGATPSVFNMAAHGPAAGPAGQRREQAARRGQPGDVPAGLWPGFDAGEVPITSVTNGVHAPTWVSREIARARRARRCPSSGCRPGEGWDAVDKVSDEELWALRADAAGAAGRGGAPPAARLLAAARAGRRRAGLDRPASSTRTC